MFRIVSILWPSIMFNRVAVDLLLCQCKINKARASLQLLTGDFRDAPAEVNNHKPGKVANTNSTIFGCVLQLDFYRLQSVF